MIEKYVDAAELKRLISVLVVILGCLIIAGLFASIVVPGLRNANRPATPTAVVSTGGESGWANREEAPPERGSVIPPVDPKTLIEPSAALAARGEELFGRNCAQCHGQLGRGDGPAAATMSPKPRNLSVADGWKNGLDMPAVFKTLSEGISGTSMASFDYLSKKDRMALVHYVQSLSASPRKMGNLQAMEALSKQLAAAGEIVPNRIRVSTAINKLSREYKAAPPIAIDEHDPSPGSRILQRVLIDPDRAGRFLAGSQSWQSGYPDLAATILANAPGNGFSISAASLSPSEWQALHSQLLMRTKPQK